MWRDARAHCTFSTIALQRCERSFGTRALDDVVRLKSYATRNALKNSANKIIKIEMKCTQNWTFIGQPSEEDLHDLLGSTEDRTESTFEGKSSDLRIRRSRLGTVRKRAARFRDLVPRWEEASHAPLRCLRPVLRVGPRAEEPKSIRCTTTLSTTAGFSSQLLRSNAGLTSATDIL